MTIQRKVVLGSLLFLVLGTAPQARAEEPIDEFLTELQEKRHFDVALRYVERMAKSDLAPKSFKQQVDYQRGSLLVNSSRNIKNTDAKREKLNQAQQSFKRFLDSQPNHPSASLARSQLGNILVERARQLMTKAKTAGGSSSSSDPALLKEAGKVYAEAYKSLAQSRTEIGKQYKALGGNRDPKVKQQQKELREKYVQTYLAIARVLFEQADTLEGKQRDAKLKAASKEFGEIVDKYRAFSASLLALRYQGECCQLMDDHKQALTYFRELLANPSGGVAVQRLKAQALTMSVKSLLASERNKGPDKAIISVTEWLKKKRGLDDRDPTVLALKLALARAYKQKSELTKDDTQSNRAKRDARTLADEVARRRSPSQTEAQELLVALGGSTQTRQASLENAGSATNFAEAHDAAKKTIDALKLVNARAKILGSQLDKVNDPGRRAEIESKLSEAETQATTERQRALELFEQADRLAKPDDLIARNGVRYYLAYFHYVRENYRQAAVIGGYVALQYPNSDVAQKCASVALAARQRLYQTAEGAARETQGNELAKLAELMARQFPGESGGNSAIMTLLDVSVSRGDVAKAESLLENIPPSSPLRADAELRIGQAIWRAYLKGLSAASGAEKSAPELTQLKERAQAILAQGIERVDSSDPKESAIRAALSLAQIYVDAGDAVKALEVLNRDGFGALKLAESGSPWTRKIPGLTTEAYKTAIRAHVATAAVSGDTAKSINAAQDMLDNLKEQFAKQPNGKTKMISIYISLAKDLERQLTIAAPDDRKALSRGFESFLRGAAEGNKDVAVQNWAGATFFSLGQGMLQGNKSSPEAQRYFTESAKAYEQVLMMAKSQPDALTPNALMQVQARLAMAWRQLGKYSEAMDLFAKLLGNQKKAYLNIQIEAAKTLQQWGTVGGKAEALTKAIKGDKPGKDSRNAIWGWGRIAKVVAKNEQYRDTFHEARYNIALCRYKSAATQSGKQKIDTFKLAKKDITITKTLYKLGTKQQAKRYETLLKAIQKSLGEKPVGFAS